MLLQIIRRYYPRTEGKEVDDPPPFTPEGGDFQYEFPSGNGIDHQNFPSTPGPPHWCVPRCTFNLASSTSSMYRYISWSHNRGK
mmetsp:Transcript_50120/g.55988  ORF Transcript_50120/g.55988 Transcript_50120/m.55988 type:complete len:84 (-) Transcript_50120:140-391(-)